MLTAQQLLTASPGRRSIRSLRQQYDLYIMDRIEHYKNSIPRDELLRLADDAMLELRSDDQQFLLTEVLAQTAVDELIKKRLGIRSFESWRKQHPKLRATQRNPIHWNIDPSHLVAGLAPRVEPGDRILVVGSGAESCGFLLAAHEAEVTYLDRDFASIERAEFRVASEALSCTFEAYCVVFGTWLPTLSGRFELVVIDAGTLATLSPGERRQLLGELQGITAPGGLHALVPDQHGTGPEGFASHYAAWQREPLPPAGRRGRNAASRGALFARPAQAVRPADAARHDASA
jgi:hypothetical protein